MREPAGPCANGHVRKRRTGNLSDGGECGIKSRDQVVCTLDPDREPDGVLPDALLEKLLLTQLGMRRAGRMDHKRFHIRDICKEREDRQIVDKLLCGPGISLYFKGKDGAAASVKAIP